MKSITSYNIHASSVLVQPEEFYEGRYHKDTCQLVASHTVFSSDNTTAAFDLLDPDPRKLRGLIQQIASEDECTLRAIVAFSHDVVNCFHLSRNGCVRALYIVLATTTRETSAYLALLSIGNVAGNTTDHKVLTASQGTRTLLRAVQTFPLSCRIQKAFVTSVMHLSFGPAARSELAACGVIDVLAQMLPTFNSETLLMALTTLKRFAADGHFHRQLLEGGTLDRLQALHTAGVAYPREAQECIMKLLHLLQQVSSASMPYVPAGHAHKAVVRA